MPNDDLIDPGLKRWKDLPTSTNVQYPPALGMIERDVLEDNPQFQAPSEYPRLRALDLLGHDATPEQQAFTNGYLPDPLPTTPLADPDAAPDPSITAHRLNPPKPLVRSPADWSYPSFKQSTAGQDLDGWTAQPVDHDPFTVPGSSTGGRVGFADGGAPERSLRIVTASGAHDFHVETAKDATSRAQGLMHRASMPADQGMLFEFDREAPASFSMKNTHFPLDMIFLSRTGAVTNIVRNAQPMSARAIPSGPPCMAVLELNGGTAASIGLKVGDRVQTGGRAGFQGGGGLDDDGVASGATEESADGQPVQEIPASAIPSTADERYRPPEGGSRQVSHGYPATIPGVQSGENIGGSGGMGVRPEFAPAGPDVFHQAISEGKAASSHGPMVTLHSPEEYTQMRTFLSTDTRSGFALDGDNIVSVFRHPESQGNLIQRAMPTAIAEGGRRLDAYDPILPEAYAKTGFKSVARLPFDPQEAPTDWDHERFGHPDIVFMVHDPENYSATGGKPVATYDEGIAAQNEALKEIAGRPLTAPQAVDRPATGLMGSEEALQRQREGLEPPGEWSGGRIGFADGGLLEPVDHDPFPPEPQVQPSDVARAKGFPEPRSPMHDRILAASQDEPAPGAEGRQIYVAPQAPDRPAIAGHVAAEQVPGQNLTPKYLEAKPQGTLSPGDPSLGETVQQKVSEGAQRLGVPDVGAERIGSAVRTGAEYAPVTSNILSASDAYQAGQRGDYLGATLSALGAVPIPGAGAAERAGVGAIERGADGILRHADPAFQEGRIATTTPWSKKLPDAHQSGEGTIGHDTMQASSSYPATADIIKEMPYTGVKTKVPAQDGKKAKTTTAWTPTGDLNIPADATPEEAHEAFINHAKSNILALHDAVPDDIRQGSMQWYDGANTIAKQRAQQYDKPLENIAGTYAALSPQMDWYKNASLGDRVMDISQRQGNFPFSPEMQNWTDGYLKNSSSADTADSAAIYDRIKGLPLGQITDSLDRAHWIRAYDEAHNDRAYNLVNPDGTFGAPVQTKGGANAGAGWGSMDAIANAVKAFEAKDMPTISRAMGGGHKVRNFYNNILNPNAPTGDVTVDTHAIAAALLRPLSGSDKDTAIGLGTAPPTNAMTGSKGLYGAYAEAYRRAAAERGILPRQMQSITWEAIRGLYSPAEKRSATFRQRVNDAWARHRTGEWNQQQVQQHLMVNPETGASRIRPPSWYTGSAIEEPDD